MKGSAAAGGEDDVELLKAVAQAWHAQSGNPRAVASAAAQGADDDGGGGGVSSSGTRRAGVGGPGRRRPSRFKLEAAAIRDRDTRGGGGGERAWDFAQSLWDTYELVAVARRLESGLVLADHHPGAAAAQERAATTREGGGGGGGVKRARESSRSLRSIFLRSSWSSSRRCKALPNTDLLHCFFR
ncbi:uncharacterized protein [Oryza sativa Japonica Group]|uniref:uncharacterized protein isoform X3 n=1 Tax=Oryza sativa subsp. japonica TaxID=39947 RepID=UPI0007754C12|nr:uncharacterized protein LOC4329855 isoform X2 [Oryza sativa Japonica Group]